MMPKTELCLWRDQHIDALLFLADRRLVDLIREAQPAEFPLRIALDLALLES